MLSSMLFRFWTCRIKILTVIYIFYQVLKTHTKRQPTTKNIYQQLPVLRQLHSLFPWECTDLECHGAPKAFSNKKQTYSHSKASSSRHKCHDQYLNPHTDDLTTRTWVWCSKQLCHDTLPQKRQICWLLLTCFIASSPIQSECFRILSRKSFRSLMEASMMLSLNLGMFLAIFSQNR